MMLYDLTKVSEGGYVLGLHWCTEQFRLFRRFLLAEEFTEFHVQLLIHPNEVLIIRPNSNSHSNETVQISKIFCNLKSC
jgi:hypothetical protein